MSSKKKTEMAKLMKRPAMSELKDSMFRANKRTEKGLAAQHYWTEKAAKVSLNDYERKQKDFINSYAGNLMTSFRPMDSGGEVSPLSPYFAEQLSPYSAFSTSSPALFHSHLSCATTAASLHDFTGERRKSESFELFSVLDPKSRRGSLPVHLKDHPTASPNPIATKTRRRSDVWDKLSMSKFNNRKLSIRQKLYDEFHMGQSQCNTEDISSVKKKTPSRRVSEPIIRLSDKLSAEIEARMARIMGEASIDSLTEPEPDNTADTNVQSTSSTISPSEKPENNSPVVSQIKVTMPKKVITGRRHSETTIHGHQDSLLPVDILPAQAKGRRFSEYIPSARLPDITD